MEAEGFAMGPGPQPVIAPGILSTSRRTILGIWLVVVQYAGPSTNGPATRFLCPYVILYGDRGWPVAHADGLAAMRLRRLDRMISAET